MSINKYYANGRIAVLSNKLFGADKFNRLAESLTVSDALKVLYEVQYGNGITAIGDNFEPILEAELNNSVALFSELCVSKNVYRYFTLQFDYLNAKVLAKSKYSRIDGKNQCFRCAEFSPEVMEEYINNDDYIHLPKPMAEALAKIDSQFAEGNRSPRLIDLTLDKAMFADLERIADFSTFSWLRKYFFKTVDGTNIIMLFRARKTKMTKEQFSELLIDGGKFDKDLLLEFYDYELDEIVEYYHYQPMQEFFIQCVRAYELGNLSTVEQFVKKEKMEILSTDVNQTTVQPLVEHFLKKVEEIDKIRYILICIKNGVDKNTIKERLVEFYA